MSFSVFGIQIPDLGDFTRLENEVKGIVAEINLVADETYNLSSMEHDEAGVLGGLLAQQFVADGKLDAIRSGVAGIVPKIEEDLVAISDIESQLRAINDLLGLRRPTSLRFDIPVRLTKRGDPMPGTVSITDNHDLRVPLKWADDVGPVHPDAGNVTGSSDNTAVISAVDVAADGSSVVLRTAGDGTCNVTVSDSTLKLSDTISVTVGQPVASSLEADVADAVPVAKGTAA